MKTTAAAIIVALVIAAIAGCGQSIHWFPGSSSGQTPSPVPSGATASPTVQQDTIINFLSADASPASAPYQVKFNNLTTSTITTAISISGSAGGNSEYSVNGGTFTSASGTVKGGDRVSVRHTSSNNGQNQTIQSILNIGGATATFTSTTSFLSFSTRTYAPANTTDYKSAAIIINSSTTLPTGFALPATIKIDATNSTGSNHKIWIGNTLVSDNTTIDPSQGAISLQLSHDTPSTAGATATTVAILTPTNGTSAAYILTYKSINQ